MRVSGLYMGAYFFGFLRGFLVGDLYEMRVEVEVLLNGSGDFVRRVLCKYFGVLVDITPGTCSPQLPSLLDLKGASEFYPAKGAAGFLKRFHKGSSSVQVEDLRV